MILQQATGNPPLNLPLILTRNQIGYDGNLGFKNLLTSFGLEIRYYTPYKQMGIPRFLASFLTKTRRLSKWNFLKLPPI